ncbi:SDR family NAD(P)-dependent oxidoreductase [bacterium]|nr:SDR family NAD(P)-dependent oxidoreductase [bacterium]
MHVAITGASSGIGEALVREYVRAGAAVTLVARRKEKLDEIAKAAGGKTHVVGADLSKPEQMTAWLEPSQKALGPIDVLVNNAGVQIVARTVEVDPDKAEEMLRVDLLAPLRLTRAVLPDMLARRSGTIVDVSSVSGLAPTPGMFHYSAAKAGIAAASECLRGELRGTGVHVVTVYPGPVHTPMEQAALASYPKAARISMLPTGTAEVLARRIRRAVEKRRARVIYPRFYGLTRHFPNLTRWAMDVGTPAPLSRPS